MLESICLKCPNGYYGKDGYCYQYSIKKISKINRCYLLSNDDIVFNRFEVYFLLEQLEFNRLMECYQRPLNLGNENTARRKAIMYAVKYTWKYFNTQDALKHKLKYWR